MRYLICLLLFLSLDAMAQSLEIPISLSGRLLEAENLPVEHTSVKFRVSITNDNGHLIYSEIHNLNMTGTNGYFKLPFLEGISDYSPNGKDIFSSKNYSTPNGSWFAEENDTRKISVSVQIGSNPWVDFSDDTIGSVPYSKNAVRIGGKTISEILQVSNLVTQSKLEELMGKSEDLISLTEGSSPNFITREELNTELGKKQSAPATGNAFLTKVNNLSDLGNPSSARTNLGLGSISTQNFIVDDNIISMKWEKLSGTPTAFPPVAHTHDISNVNGLTQAIQDRPMKADFCTSADHKLTWNSVTNLTNCQPINLGGDFGTIGGSSGVSNVLKKINGRPIVLLPGSVDPSILIFDGTSFQETPLSNFSFSSSSDIQVKNLKATGVIIGSSQIIQPNQNSLTFQTNTAVVDYGCSQAISLGGVQEGGTYTLINKNTGSAKCRFVFPDVPDADIKFAPENSDRTSGAYTAYAFLRAGNIILITWSSSFVSDPP